MYLLKIFNKQGKHNNGLNQISNIGLILLPKLFDIMYIIMCSNSFAFMMVISHSPKSNNYKIFCTKIKIL